MDTNDDICHDCKHILTCEHFGRKECSDYELKELTVKFQMPKFEIIKEKIAQLNNVSETERTVLFGIVNQLGFMLCITDISTFTGLSKHIIKKTISELEKKKIIKISLYDDRKNLKNVEFTFGGVKSAIS